MLKDKIMIEQRGLNMIKKIFQICFFSFFICLPVQAQYYSPDELFNISVYE